MRSKNEHWKTKFNNNLNRLSFSEQLVWFSPGKFFLRLTVTQVHCALQFSAFWPRPWYAHFSKIDPSSSQLAFQQHNMEFLNLEVTVVVSLIITHITSKVFLRTIDVAISIKTKIWRILSYYFSCYIWNFRTCIYLNFWDLKGLECLKWKIYLNLLKWDLIETFDRVSYFVGFIGLYVL